jgi:aspartate/methionine/tyrosine aminotransferase
MSWAKTHAQARVDLARSGVAHCPASLLGLRRKDLVVELPVQYGYWPLLSAVARRYAVAPEQVFTVPGGTSLANWLVYATLLEGTGREVEVIVERPTYESLLAIPRGMQARVRRLDRRFGEGWAIDLDRFESLVNARTKLAVVTNLHNPSGARIDPLTLRRMARILARVGAFLLVDEVHLECVFGTRTESSVHAGPNVVATNSLTKAYGLDGLRAGWILGPRRVVARAGRIYDALGVAGVALGEQATLAAFKNLAAISKRAHEILDPNLEAVRRFFTRERRLAVVEPPGGSVCFPRLPPGLGSQLLFRHLLERYDTLVVPGIFFESPRHIRISFGCESSELTRGLSNLGRALDDLDGLSGTTPASGQVSRPRSSYPS